MECGKVAVKNIEEEAISIVFWEKMTASALRYKPADFASSSLA